VEETLPETIIWPISKEAEEIHLHKAFLKFNWILKLKSFNGY
jgi:hypothetical protein